ncbi:MAG: glycosyltransferase family 39 protein [Methylococcaceae bacterium]
MLLTNQQRSSQFLLLGLLGLMGFRLIYLFIVDLDLIGDESYYWDWSRHLDWCYYSKPPMVAWLIRLFTELFGSSTPIIRIPAALLGTLMLWPFYQLTREIYDHPTALLATLLIISMPAMVLVSFIMTIDPPLYFFWMCALLFLHRSLFTHQRNRDWLYAGIAVGAALLSKPTAIALPIMTFLFLGSQPSIASRSKLGLAVFIIPIIVAIIPQLIWNAQHDWIMLQHNQNHFAAEALSITDRLSHFIGFVLQQTLLISPVTLLITIVIICISVWRFFKLTAIEQWLILLGPLPLIGIFGLAVIQKVQGNWSIPFYFTGIILVAGWINQKITLFNPKFSFRRLKSIALYTGTTLVAITYLLPFLSFWLPQKLNDMDPTNRLRQWQDLATQVDRISKPKNKNAHQFILIDGHRDIVSELAFYLPDQPTIYHWQKNPRIESQYGLWPGLEQHIAGNGLVISMHPWDQLAQPLKSSFYDLQFLGEAVVLQHTKREKRLYIYQANRLLHWPPPTT